MKKIFLDTNFIIDYFVREDSGGDAERLLQFGDKNNVNFFISYLSVANFAYIMRKMSADKLKSLIFSICSIFNVVDNTREQILKSLDSDFKDFEDGLQYQCAIASRCDFIISRNQKDFNKSEIPVLSASEFLDNIQHLK